MNWPALPKFNFSFNRPDTGDKLLISVSARQVSAAHWRHGHFAGCDMFTYSDEGLGAFKSYLAEIRKSLPVHMLVDAVEEDYRFESLPHSTGRDRSAMVNRKLKQHYRNTPYISAQLRGRDSDKRRDDRYLFCALTNPELIAGWVQAVIECELPLAGIYLLPAVSRELVERLQLAQTNLLLVSRNSSGLRLTFLREQTLRISRLARIDSTTPQAIKSYAEEISNTRLYLHALRVMTLDEQLSVLIVDSDDTLAELAEIIARDNPNIECRRLARAEIVARVGIAAPALDSSADALYLHLLGLHAPDSNLAPANVTFGYRRQKFRRGIHAATAVTAFVMAVSGAYNWYRIYDIDLEIKSDSETAARQTAARQIAELQAQYREATQQYPAAPTSGENLRRAVEISQKIGATTRSPETMMNIVSRVLEHSPAITVKSFGWKYGATNIEPGGKTAEPGFPAAAGSARRQSGLIDGEVRPFRGDHRAAIETINGFANLLSQQPEVAEVKITKLPLNISPASALSGNTTEGGGLAGTAEFKLLLVFKPTL
ncbi:MAG: hypothetical protein A3G24_22235 [Betaproteobacteria bacterium RIFCSPLOWO2_12_FULL_62_13]|nr:MAG: hypothetical protein A3G24_22235 [Betaproteobacteria bacterium RIFCSPLOWO2_12_FULL_62_13]